MNKADYATAEYWGLSEHVKCLNCIHRPKYDPVHSDCWEPEHIYFPDDVCMMQSDDGYYNHFPEDDFFCASFKEGNNDLSDNIN